MTPPYLKQKFDFVSFIRLTPLSLFVVIFAGILFGNYSYGNKSLSLIAITIFLIFFCFFLFFNKKVAIFCVLCISFCFGYFSIQNKLYPYFSPDHIINYLDAPKMKIVGKIVSFTKHYEKRNKVVVSCQSISQIKKNKKDTRETSGRILLNIYNKKNENGIPAYKYGDIIMFRAKIKSIRNFNNPGRYDYKRFLNLQGIYGTSYATEKNIIVLAKNEKTIITKFVQKIEKLRTNYYSFVKENAKNKETVQILTALVTGKKEIITNEMRDLFSKTGTSHLLAISGVHLSIIAFLFFHIFYWFLSLSKSLLISGKAKKAACIMSIIPILFYAVFSGFSPSVQRASIMLIIVLFSFVLEKEKDILSNICLAGVLILILDPAAIFSISFQLSFSAVIFIVYGFVALQRYILILKGKNTHHLFLKALFVILTSLLAGLGTFPLTIYHFNIISFVQVISNFFAIPITGFILLPSGFLSLVFHELSFDTTIFIIDMCSYLVSFLVAFLKILAQMPFTWARKPILDFSQVFLIYMAFLFLFLFFKKQKRKFIALSGISFLISISIGFYNSKHFAYKTKNLTINVIDVGQGNSAFIKTSENKFILVDGGGFIGSSFDTGRYIVAPFLWKKRIDTIDYVILTHPQSDHLNGLLFVLQNFKVHFLIKNSDESLSQNYKKLIKICKEKNIKILVPNNNFSELSLGSSKIIFYNASHNQDIAKDFNDNSIVFKFKYNDFTMLFTGDISKKIEKHLSDKYFSNLKADIMLAPHHGSSTSSSEIFLDKVAPKSVIISCGFKNRYGFPHDKVLKRYDRMKKKVFRTDQDGAVFINSDGKEYIIKTYKGI